jgi:hypothetical protein
MILNHHVERDDAPITHKLQGWLGVLALENGDVSRLALWLLRAISEADSAKLSIPSCAAPPDFLTPLLNSASGARGANPPARIRIRIPMGSDLGWLPK